MCVGLGSGGWYTDGIERPFLFTCPFHGKLFIELPARQMDSFHPLHGNGSLILVEIVSNAQHKSNWVAKKDDETGQGVWPGESSIRILRNPDMTFRILT